MTAGLTPRPPCRNCGEPRKPRANQPGYKGANGWCEACYKRWLQAGRPPEGPPPPLSPSEKTTKGNNTRRAAKEPGTVNMSLAGQSWPYRAACRDMDTDLLFPVGMAVDPRVPARVRLVPGPAASAWTSLSPRGRRASGAAMTEDERAKERRRRTRRGEVAA